MYFYVNKCEREKKREKSVVLLMIKQYVHVVSLTCIYLRICSEQDIALHDTNVSKKLYISVNLSVISLNKKKKEVVTRFNAVNFISTVFFSFLHYLSHAFFFLQCRCLSTRLCQKKLNGYVCLIKLPAIYNTGNYFKFIKYAESVCFLTFSHTRVIRLIQIRVCIITLNLTG